MDLLLGVTTEWLELVSLACCIGVLVSSLWIVGPSQEDEPAGQEVLAAGMRRMLGIGSAVLLASTMLGLLPRAAELSGYPMARVLPVLPTVLLATHLGHTWIVRAAAALALLVTAMATRRSSRPHPSSYAMLGCAVVASAMRSASGHASDAGDFSVAEMVDLLHLLAAMVWGGGLLALSLAILPRLAEHGDRASRSVARVATRFSAIAGAVVAFMVLTAPYQAWAYGDGVERLGRSRYGATVIAKIALLLVLLALGAFNRYVSVPRLQEWAGSARTGSGPLGRVIAPALRHLARDAHGEFAAARFTRTVRLEAVLVTAVLLCAVLLRWEVPARHAAPPEQHAFIGIGGLVATSGGDATR